MLSTDPSYDNRTIASTLKMQIWIATNNRDVPRVMKTKFFRSQLWSLVWFQVRATSCHLTSSKSAWKSTPKCIWVCWRMWWSPGSIRWLVADPGRGSRTRCLFHQHWRELSEYSADGGDQAGFGVVEGHVGDVLDVWPNEVVQRIQVEGGGGPMREGYKVVALLLKPSFGLFGHVGRIEAVVETEGGYIE